MVHQRILVLALLLLLAAPASAQEPVQEPVYDDCTMPTPVQELFMAVGLDDVAEVQRLLDLGVPPDATDPAFGDGVTALMVCEDPEIVHLLLTAGADPNARDADGATPLHHAVLGPEAVDVCTMLLEAGTDPNARAAGHYGETPLFVATDWFFGPDIDMGARIMALLVEHGADIDATDEFGATLLHVAAMNDKPALAQVCLDLGANPHLVDQSGKTPLVQALELNAPDVAEILRAAGAGS